MVHEPAATTSTSFLNHIKEEEEEEVEDPMYDENIIQLLEIVPADTEIEDTKE